MIQVIKNKEGTNIKEFICDKKADMADIDLRVCGMGTTCFVIEEDTIYILDSKKEWVVVTKKNAISLNGITEDIKQALLNLFAHVAYIDADSQTYVDALEEAMYPATNLTSISASFNQGTNVIYDTASLDDLEQYLTVIANYIDSTHKTISNYTLSGTLTEGTSTITVSYEGFTDTFNVTVSHLTMLYPLENGTHTFTQNLRTLTVTDNSHFEYIAPNATNSGSPSGAFLNLSRVSENDNSGTSNTNITKSDVLFTIPSGANVVFEVLNIDFTRLSESNVKYSVYLRSGSTKAIETGDRDVKDDAIISKTLSSDAPITCVCAYLRNQYKTFEADIRLIVNGERWI